MRSFAILCLVAVACADKLGYNYKPVPHSDSGLSFVPNSNSHGLVGSNRGLGGINGDSIGRGFGGQSNGIDGLGVTGRDSIGRGAGGHVPGNLGDAQNDAPSYNAPAELEKEFYTFSAPEAEFDDANGGQNIVDTLKQGLRVIFIKAPENRALENAAVTLAKHTAEQKTAIYVLTKQADIGDLTSKFNVVNKNINNKPEVHFVKYRTPEDAANAQKAIQSQYDSLGGASQSHDGGIAPVINFASQVPIRSAPHHIPDNSYLPSSVFRRV